MQFVYLGPEDLELLKAFRCNDFNAWTKRVEHIVRQELPVELETLGDATTVLGMVNDEGVLCAVTAWTPAEEEGVWDVIVLAVAYAERRNGLGRTLMAEIRRVAREQGVEYLAYLVHRANAPMLAFNNELAPEMQVDDDADYWYCVLETGLDPPG